MMVPEPSWGTPGRASVIVPSWNARAHLSRCLDSLFAQTYADLEIVVVDNGSTDGSLDDLRAASGRLRLVDVGYNSGFSGAVTRGLAASTGQFVGLLNDDAVADPRWVERMIEALVSDPRLGSCAYKMLLEHRRTMVNAAGLRFRPRLDACSGVIGWGAVDGADLDRPSLVLAASGGAAFYRRAALDAVGGFDEDYFLYYEDFDVGLRLQLAGYDCLYVPGAVVLHDDEAFSRSHPDWVLRLNARNSCWTAVKCLPAPILAALITRAGPRRVATLLSEMPAIAADVRARQGLPPTGEPWRAVLRRLAAKRANTQALRRVSAARLIHRLVRARRPHDRQPSQG